MGSSWTAMPGRKAQPANSDSNDKFVWTTTKAMRRHLLERLKMDNLFTLSECKLVVKHLCCLIVAEAKTDFDQLLKLDEHYRETVVPKLATLPENVEPLLDVLKQTEEEKQLIDLKED